MRRGIGLLCRVPGFQSEGLWNMSELALDQPAESLEKRRRHRATRPQLLTRAQLDKRTNAAKFFDRLARAIEADLGGRDQLSAIELALIEGFCGAAVTLENLNSRLLLGEAIDPAQIAQTVSAMVRVGSRLGLRRRAKDITGLSLGDVLAADALRQRTANGSSEDTP
jgi:hypothetical protein